MNQQLSGTVTMRTDANIPPAAVQIKDEPRIWSGRIFTKDNPFIGTPFLFKAPYGVYMNATQLLARASATRQILRFTLGPATAKRLREQRANGEVLVRYEEAFDRLALTHGINWSA